MDPEKLRRLIEAGVKTKDQALLNLIQEYVGNPLLTFRPRPDKPEQFDEQASFVNDKFPGLAVALGGNGSGKSEAAAYKVARFLYNTPPPRPNTPFWVVSQSFEISCGVCWQEKLSKYIQPAHVKAISWYNKTKNWAQDVVLRPHKNGNNWVITFKSADQERRRFQGASIGGFWIDEQVEYEIIMELWARCRDYNYPGAMMYSLTPLEPDPDLESIFNENHKYPNWKFYRLNSACNTRLAEGFLDTLIESEIDERKQTRLTGAFASYVGIIYDKFIPRVHVIDPFEIPLGWYHIRGLDIGFSHPTCCLWIAKDSMSQRYYVYDEYYKAGASIDEHIDAISKVPWDYDEMYYGATYADYGAAQERHEFSLRGLPTSAANKDVRVGIAAVQRLLRPAVDGKPRLYVFSNCENLIREMRTYSWAPGLDKPIKENDHAVDALRYAIYSDYRDVHAWSALAMPEKTKRHAV